MVICPCIMMMPNIQRNIPRRDTSRLPLPKTSALYGEDFQLKNKSSLAEDIIQGQPSSGTRIDSCDKKLNSIWRHDSVQAPQKIKKKADSLVLSNLNGKYVGTKPIKSLIPPAAVQTIHNKKSLVDVSLKRNSKHYSSSGQRLQLRKPGSNRTGCRPTPVDLSPSESTRPNNLLLPAPKSVRTEEQNILNSKSSPTETMCTTTKFQFRRLEFRKQVLNDPVVYNDEDESYHTNSLPPKRRIQKHVSNRMSYAGVGGWRRNIKNSDQALSKQHENLGQNKLTCKSKASKQIQPSINTKTKKNNQSDVTWKSLLPKLSNNAVYTKAPRNDDGISHGKRDESLVLDPRTCKDVINVKLSQNDNSKDVTKFSTLSGDSGPKLSKNKSTFQKEKLLNSEELSEDRQIENIEILRKETEQTENFDKKLNLIEEKTIVEFSEESEDDLSDTDDEFLAYESLIEEQETIGQNDGSGQSGADIDIVGQNTANISITDSLMIRSDVTLVADCCFSDDQETEGEEEEEDLTYITSSSEDNLSGDNFLVESFQLLQKEVKIINESLEKHSSNSYNSETSFGNTDDEDDGDYIDIDCDVQPMETLKRPLIYGYGNKVMTRNRSTPNYRFSWDVPHVNDIKSEDDNAMSNNISYENEKPEEESMTSTNFRETYWDYWLAKNKLKDHRSARQQTPVEPLSTIIGKRCCSSEKILYDPEIMLAQVSHPRSLSHATFSEYSTHIKSSIMKRYSFQNGEEDEMKVSANFGSNVDVSDQISQCVDPGYYSESDASKLKAISAQNYDSLTTLNADFAPTLPISQSRSQQFSSDSNINCVVHQPTSMNHNQQQPSERFDDIFDKEMYPYSYHRHLSSRHSIGENPWTHLLPNISSPQIPRRDVPYYSEDEYGESVVISSSPSVTSLPAWVQQIQLEKEKLNQDEISRVVFTKPKEKKSPITDIKKEPKKSFLPTFFRKSKTPKSSTKFQNQSADSDVDEMKKRKIITSEVALKKQITGKKLNKFPKSVAYNSLSMAVPESHRSNLKSPGVSQNDPKRHLVMKNKNVSFKKQELENFEKFSINCSQISGTQNDGLSDSLTKYSETGSEKSNSSSSSSSSTKSSQSTSSQDSVKTVIHRSKNYKK